MNAKSLTAAEPITTLSAPARSVASNSARVFTPPPTASGTDMQRATLLTIAGEMQRDSLVAITSSKTSSSTSRMEKTLAAATTEPTVRQLLNCSPFTRLTPSVRSVGMTRRLAIGPTEHVGEQKLSRTGAFLWMELETKHVPTQYTRDKVLSSEV